MMRCASSLAPMLLGVTLVLAQACGQGPMGPESGQDAIKVDAKKVEPATAPMMEENPVPDQPPSVGFPGAPPTDIPGNGPGYGGGSQGFLQPIGGSHNSDDDDDEPCEDCEEDEDCDNGLDDDSDGLVDCRDPECLNVSCNDNNACTANDVCTRALVCQGAPVVCNDDNPCTLDTCVSSTPGGCVFTNNTDIKNVPGGCERDGNACTVGICTPSNPLDQNSTFTCFEEERTFFSDPAVGCRDNNQCTADSCVVTCADRDLAPLISGGSPCNSTTTKDISGNVVITGGGWQCVNEVIEDIGCFVETDCTPGICTLAGTGMPGSDFAVQCLALPAASPLSQCPDTDSSNDCIENICVVGLGCMQKNVALGTPCSSNNDPCLTQTTCDGNGACTGLPNNGASCDDFNPCTTADTCQDDTCAGVSNNGASCNDFNPCTTTDTCVGTTCTGGADATNGTACGGFFGFCDIPVCQDGLCILTPTTCDDTNPCTIDTCDLFAGCEHEAFADNTPAGGPCTVPNGVGLCAEGALVCIGGQVTTQCASLYEPGSIPETCNGVDDNCDGLIDNTAAGQCPKFVFVTSASSNGYLDGVDGADLICQTAADNSSITNLHAKTFRAWISDSTYSPSTSSAFHAGGPYLLIDGTTVVAASSADLFSGTLAHQINTDNSGTTGISAGVWTGTNANGTAAILATCQDWSVGFPLTSGLFGLSSATDSTWTDDNTALCDTNSFRLYCFEQ